MFPPRLSTRVNWLSVKFVIIGKQLRSFKLQHWHFQTLFWLTMTFLFCMEKNNTILSTQPLLQHL